MPPNQGEVQEVRVKFTIDAEDLRRQMENTRVAPPAPTTAGGRGTPPPRPPGQRPPSDDKKVEAGSTFARLLKPLAAFAGVAFGITALVRQSSIMNTYLGAMGKIFGAAIDILLAPFTPIFNLILMFLMQLLPVIQKLAAWFGNVIKGFQEGGITGGLKAIFGGVEGGGVMNALGPMVMAGMAAGGAGLLGKLLGKGAGLPLIGGLLGKAGGVLGTVGKFAGPLGLAAGGAMMATSQESPGWMKAIGTGLTMWGGAKLGALVGSMIAPGIGTAIGGLVGGLAGLLGPTLYNFFTQEHSPSKIDEIAASRYNLGKVPGGGNISSSKSMVFSQTNNFSIEATQRLRPEEFSPYLDQVGRKMALGQLMG